MSRWRLTPTKEIAGNLHHIIPPGEEGDAKIDHLVLDDHQVRLGNLRAHIHGRPDMVCPPGTYVRLQTKVAAQEAKDPLDSRWRTMMSDVPYEVKAGRSLKIMSRGEVLVLGLGLAATTLPVVMKPNVTKVTVIEKNKGVMLLVLPPILKALPPKFRGKLTVINDDANTWKPPKGQRYDTIWIDIWPSICGDNLPEMMRLKRKYSQCLRPRTESPGRWIGVWEEHHLRRERL